MDRYAKPATVDEALALLAQDRWTLLAGGTDFYPAAGNRPITGNVLDLSGIAGLSGIVYGADGIVIGARTTWSAIMAAPLPPAFDALKQAAREVGSVQIQNRGTIAGNLCNASPAADGVPPLLTLDAEVELASLEGVRRLPLCGFLQGNRRTARRPDEVMTAIRIPARAAQGTSAFVKLGARRYLVISIAMAAARIELDAAGAIASAAVAVGACSAVATRLSGIERALAGTRLADVPAALDGADFAGLSPIDDVRGSAAYRMRAAREIVARAVSAALQAPDAVRAA